MFVLIAQIKDTTEHIGKGDINNFKEPTNQGGFFVSMTL